MNSTPRWYVMALLLLVAGCGGGSGSSSRPDRYSISGQVGGDVLQGVSITLNGVTAKTTDASGAYAFSDLANGTYTVSAALAGYTLNPATRTVTVQGADVAGIDFTATLTTHEIAGSITVSGVGSALAGVKIYLRGDRNDSVLSDAAGDFLFSGLLAGDYVLSPSLSGHTFNPSTITLSISASVSAIDFSATPLRWTLRASGGILRGVARSASRTVAVGDRGLVALSDDEVDWVLTSVEDVGEFNDVTWDGSRFTSPDGVVWTEQTPLSRGGFSDVLWDGSRFVAVGFDGTVETAP